MNRPAVFSSVTAQTGSRRLSGAEARQRIEAGDAAAQLLEEVPNAAVKGSETTEDPQVQTRNAWGKSREGRPMFSKARAFVQKIRKQVHRDEGRVLRVPARFEHEHEAAVLGRPLDVVAINPTDCLEPELLARQARRPASTEEQLSWLPGCRFAARRAPHTVR